MRTPPYLRRHVSLSPHWAELSQTPLVVIVQKREAQEAPRYCFCWYLTTYIMLRHILNRITWLPWSQYAHVVPKSIAKPVHLVGCIDDEKLCVQLAGHAAAGRGH
jgi:hypothetical protein